MSQKSSLPQVIRFVSEALMPNTPTSPAFIDKNDCAKAIAAAKSLPAG
jgi:hypothetical protein